MVVAVEERKKLEPYNEYLDDFEVELKRHKRLIHAIAYNFRKSAQFLGLTFDDLYQESQIAFLKSYNKYNPTLERDGRKAQFSSYAYRMMQGYMMSYLNATQHHGIYVPRRVRELGVKLASNGLLEAPIKEICSKLGEKEHHVKEALEYDKTVKNMLSMDFSYNDDSDAECDLNEGFGFVEQKYEDLEFTDDFQQFLRILKKHDDKCIPIILLRAQGKTQQEIEDYVGFGQSHISRLTKKAKEYYKLYKQGELQE
ncbi:sigma-70 family RNA polymerase sigma factor [Bacillus paranthracis]|uniref:sigma-70 family RNA polymerase sigma factor n=1 Tax=Bacillus paranthracis TaxID=2026186 RepID=UPI002204894C|nr:sigma-70 family RNA polymerase sigma factor [Bacillus paranthracis]UXR28824.1 RNA polymerase sigma factor [Bacillus phage Nachito]